MAQAFLASSQACISGVASHEVMGRQSCPMKRLKLFISATQKANDPMMG